MREIVFDRWRRHRRFVRFVLAAGASVPFNIASRIWFSTWLDFRLAVVLAHGVGMAIAYTLTRLFVFEPSGRSIAIEFTRFASVNLLSVAVTWIVSVALVYEVFPVLRFDFHPELVGHVAGLGCSAFTSFLGHGYFTFRKTRDARPKSSR